MASLRAPFVQSFNFGNPAFSIYNAVASFISLFSTPEDKQAPSEGIYKRQHKVNINSKQYSLNPSTHIYNQSIRNLIDLNINSLNRIHDNSSTDFNNEENGDLIHILSLIKQEDTSIDDIQTVLSLKLNGQEWPDCQSTLNSSFQSDSSDCQNFD